MNTFRQIVKSKRIAVVRTFHESSLIFPAPISNWYAPTGCAAAILIVMYVRCGASESVNVQLPLGISAPVVRLRSVMSPRTSEPYRLSSNATIRLRVVRCQDIEMALGGVLSLIQRNKFSASALLW